MKLEKETNHSQTEEKRRYDDACGLAHALELVGERWALLVLRELMLGARRFSEIRADLPGISANVLTQRLGDLEARGLVKKKRLPPPASVQVYEATPWALEAKPLICGLAHWAFKSPWHDGRQRVSAVAILLSMTTNFDSRRSDAFDACFQFRFGERSFFGRVEAGRFEVYAGEAPDADVMFTGHPDQLKQVVYGGAPIDMMEIAGDRALAERFVAMFDLPPKVF